jgi:hypothetical protein
LSEPITAQPPAAQSGEAQPSPVESEILYCVNHPNVETLLRCNRCGKPICLKCATLTDVGYRCKECIRGVQAAYFNAEPTDNLIIFAVALLVSAVATPIAGIIFRLIPSFFFLNLIVAFAVGGAAGGILVQILRASVGRRRSRQMNYFAVGGIVLGVLLGIGISFIFLGGIALNLALLIFAVLVAGTTFQLLR